MKTIIKITKTAAKFAATALFAAAAFAASASAQTLKIGTSPGYPPFEYIDGGQISGFDIELVTAAAAKFGAQVEFVAIEFDGLIAALKAGKIDVIASGMHKTPARAKNVTFTAPYYKSKNLYVKLAGNEKITDIAHLAGATLGAQIGTMQSAEIAALPGVKSYLNADHMVFIIATLQGKIDGFVLEQAVANGYMSKYPGKFEVFGKTTIPGEGVALAVAHGNTELAGKFDAAIEQLKADGTYAQLLKKYNIE